MTALAAEGIVRVERTGLSTIHLPGDVSFDSLFGGRVSCLRERPPPALPDQRLPGYDALRWRLSVDPCPVYTPTLTHTLESDMNSPTTTLHRGLAFLNEALEKEYAFGQMCLSIREEAFETDPPTWDRRANMLRQRELSMKHLWVPRLPKATLRPAFDLKRMLWNRESLAKRSAHFRKSHCFKISLYASTIYTHVLVCFLSNNSDARLNGIDRRFDIIDDEGELKLANTNQDLCAKCHGAASLKPLDCSCDFAGYITPVTNETGLTGPPLLVRRFDPRPTGYDAVYDADS